MRCCSQVVVVLVAVLVSASACGSESASSDHDPTFEEAHPRVYLPRHKERLQKALAAKTPAAQRFVTMVDRWKGGADVYDFQSWHAALVGQLTGEASYCTAAIKNVETRVTAEEKRIADGGRPEVARDSYLYVGDEIGDLALTYDWCFAQLTDAQKKRWLEFADRAVWNVWHHERAQWGTELSEWNGWSVDNPMNNYYYSFLRATMLLGLATHGELGSGETWIKQFRQVKLADQLVPQFVAQLPGGGSREGTGYGVSHKSLFELYDFWQGSTGEDIANETAHAEESLRLMLHQIVPTGDRLAPTGDHARDSTAALYDYHRQYLLSLMARYASATPAGAAKTLLAASPVKQMTSQFNYVYDFLYDTTEITEAPLTGLAPAYHAAGVGQVYARSGWTKDATWVNFTAGPYTEDHAHQDQGSFLLYKGGWLAYDANIDSHSGIANQINVHNVVRFERDGNVVAQRQGTESKLTALHRGPGWMHMAADLLPAYKGQNGISKVERELVFIEPNALVVFDRTTSAAGVNQVWQLNVPKSPMVNGAQASVANGGHTLTVQRVLPAEASASVHAHDQDSDFNSGFRIDHAVAGGANTFLHVLWLDGDVGAATAVETGSTRGVALTFADGRKAKVAFGSAALGGSLELTAAGGSRTTASLGAGVDALAK